MTDAKHTPGPCRHDRLTFGSGGFYVICMDCQRSWVGRKRNAGSDTDIDHDMGADGLGMLDVRAPDMAAEIAALRAMLKTLLPPTHGLYGGPLVQMEAVYEDGTDEDSARHRGRISMETIKAARALLAGKGEG